MGLVVTAAVLASASGLAPARDSASSNTVSLAQLPAEAQTTRSLIRSGGPFPFPKDGVAFGNRERLLPAQPRGYYREYTRHRVHAAVEPAGSFAEANRRHSRKFVTTRVTTTRVSAASSSE